MKKLMMCCMFALMGCGDEAEESKPLGPPPTLTVTIGEKVCQRELRGECCEGVTIFRVNARIEANVPVQNFACRARNSEGSFVTCSGPPADLNAPWEGVLVCETGDWNSDGNADMSCGGNPFGDEDQSVSEGSAGWDPLYELRKCDPATDI